MTKDHLWLHLRELPYFRALLRSVEARLIEAIDLPRPVLDVGSGDGHFASLAFDWPLDVGVDASLKPLRQAWTRRGYRSLVLADGGKLPFSDQSFGSAVSNSVLEHIPHYESVLAEIARVLRPGAPFVFTVPNPRFRTDLAISGLLRRIGMRSLAGAYEVWFMWATRTKHLFDVPTWTQTLARAGFRTEEATPYFSPGALRVLEWGHYLGVPCVLVRGLTGRWILAPTRWNLWLTERLLHRYHHEAPGPDGTYTFFLARHDEQQPR